MWQIDELNAKMKSGRTVPVWQVRDGRSGVKIPHSFRLAETAGKVAAVLNRTGNINDPRVGQWISADKHRVGLVSKARQLKEAVQAGNTAVKGQLAKIREELAELDLKIGI
jgi:hypothetical protein